jgi:N-acetylglucosaminyldiphosphoundecaprenol N-acetyl-beta-D-mannosaminyltransferase
MCFRQNILGFDFNFISYSDVFEMILRWRNTGHARLISMVNPYSILLGHRDRHMAAAIYASSLVLPDGVGIVLASRILYGSRRSRTTGPALMLELCGKPGLRHYFYGGSPTTVQRLAANLQRRCPGLDICGWYAPPFRPLTEQEDNDVIARINAVRPDVVWVGLGAPKQEKWMLAHQTKLRTTAMIGVGAAFDFHAGVKKWAPCWMRRCGLEWLYRFFQEPARMARRNVDNVIFLYKVLMCRYAKFTANVVSENTSLRMEHSSIVPDDDNLILSNAPEQPEIIYSEPIPQEV